jgi:hypothetical protein
MSNEQMSVGEYEVGGGYDCTNCMDQGCGCCEDARQVAMDDELGAEMGDPRRCPRHPNVKTSTPDGMFDWPCDVCEGEMSEDAARWQYDPENPCRQFCGLDEVTPTCAFPRHFDKGCVPNADDEIPF